MSIDDHCIICHTNEAKAMFIYNLQQSDLTGLYITVEVYIRVPIIPLYKHNEGDDTRLHTIRLIINNDVTDLPSIRLCFLFLAVSMFMATTLELTMARPSSTFSRPIFWVTMSCCFRRDRVKSNINTREQLRESPPSAVLRSATMYVT